MSVAKFPWNQPVSQNNVIMLLYVIYLLPLDPNGCNNRQDNNIYISGLGKLSLPAVHITCKLNILTQAK